MQLYSNVSCASQSAKDIDSSMGMTTMNTLDSFNESRGIKNECVRVGALSNR